MAGQDGPPAAGGTASGKTGGFADIRLLRNHWSRPAGPPACYWYLTFAGAPALRALAAQCQQAIAFPYYDPVPPEGLHLTLDRIAPMDDITPARLAAIERGARHACQGIAPFRIVAGPLGGTRGAVGFTVSPARPVRDLRAALRAATRPACPDAGTRREISPHVTIAYANTDGVPAAEAIGAVAKLNATVPSAEAAISEAALVLLERRPRCYAWQVIARIPLAGR